MRRLGTGGIWPATGTVTPRRARRASVGRGRGLACDRDGHATEGEACVGWAREGFGLRPGRSRHGGRGVPRLGTGGIWPATGTVTPRRARRASVGRGRGLACDRDGHATEGEACVGWEREGFGLRPGRSRHGGRGMRRLGAGGVWPATGTVTPRRARRASVGRGRDLACDRDGHATEGEACVAWEREGFGLRPGRSRHGGRGVRRLGAGGIWPATGTVTPRRARRASVGNGRDLACDRDGHATCA